MKTFIFILALLSFSSFAAANSTIKIVGSRPLDRMHASQAFRDKYTNNFQPTLKERLLYELGCEKIKISFHPFDIAGSGTAKCNTPTKIIVYAEYSSSMTGWTDINAKVKAFEPGRTAPYEFTFIIE